MSNGKHSLSCLGLRRGQVSREGPDSHVIYDLMESCQMEGKRLNIVITGRKLQCVELTGDGHTSNVSKPTLKVAVNVSSSGKPVLRFMYYVNEPGLTLLMKKTP